LKYSNPFQTATTELVREMEDRESERPPSSVPELIKRHKCDLKSCGNWSHTCIIIHGGQHQSLSANDLLVWDNAIRAGKATLDLPPLSVRGSPVVSRKGNRVAITNNNANPFNFFPGYPPFVPHAQMPYPPYPQLPYSPFTAGIQPPVTPEHQNRTVNPASSPLDANADIYKDVGAYMDWLIQKNPHDSQVLEEAKKVFIHDSCDVEILKTMTREDADYWKLKWGLCKRIARDVTIYLKEKKVRH
jgi:hypothetical protein